MIHSCLLFPCLYLFSNSKKYSFHGINRFTYLKNFLEYNPFPITIQGRHHPPCTLHWNHRPAHSSREHLPHSAWVLTPCEGACTLFLSCLSFFPYSMSTLSLFCSNSVTLRHPPPFSIPHTMSGMDAYIA